MTTLRRRPPRLARRDQTFDLAPLLVGQVNGIAQLIPVVAVTVFGRPPWLSLQTILIVATQPAMESWKIQWFQPPPLTDSNDTVTFRTDTQETVPNGLALTGSRLSTGTLFARMILCLSSRTPQ
jgi:hypothetical protein